MYTINEVKELLAMGFTPEMIANMNQETPQVANAKATDKPKKPVDPRQQVIFSAEFDVKKVGHTLEPDKFIGKGLKAKALRKCNTLALQKGYATVQGCKTGWRFEDEKECYDALKNFNFIHNLTVGMFLDFLKSEEDRCLKEAEYFSEELQKAQKEYGVK